ncbi:hypothetical protein BSKO_11986 [Bryopsis sp. KO-2023]|nr:hypothetical protein BSKO_11986 [Bryopsis sp. KO-2023]
MLLFGRTFLARRYRFSQVGESSSFTLGATLLQGFFWTTAQNPGGEGAHPTGGGKSSSNPSTRWDIHTRVTDPFARKASTATESVEEYWDLTDDEWEFEQDRWKSSKTRRKDPVLASGNHRLQGNLELMDELGMNPQEMKRMVSGAKAMTHSRPSAVNNKIHWCEDTLDLEPEEIKDFLLKNPWVLNYSSQIQLRPFTDACLRRGLDHDTYKNLVVSSPDVLRQARLGNFERILDGFMACGFTMDQFLRMAAIKHDISNYSVKKVIKPLSEKFLEFGLTLEDFVVIVPHAPQILAAGDAFSSGAVLDRLLDLGLNEDQIERMKRKNPNLIGSDLERRLNWWS